MRGAWGLYATFIWNYRGPPNGQQIAAINRFAYGPGVRRLQTCATASLADVARGLVPRS